MEILNRTYDAHDQHRVICLGQSLRIVSAPPQNASPFVQFQAKNKVGTLITTLAYPVRDTK